MKRSDKKNFVSKMKDELMNSSSIVVVHYSGLSVLETDELRKEMRNNGAKFRITKNRLTKLALAETQFKDIADLFGGDQNMVLLEKDIKEIGEYDLKIKLGELKAKITLVVEAE